MSAKQRLGSDPLSWLKDKETQEADEELSGVLPGEGFTTPQDTIDEICAANQAPAPEPAWRPRLVLEELNLPLCVYAPAGEVLFANRAWLELTGADPLSPGLLADYLQGKGADLTTLSGCHAAQLKDGREILMECSRVDGQDGQPGFLFASFSLKAQKAETDDSMVEPIAPEKPGQPGEASPNDAILSRVREWARPGKEQAGLVESLAASQADLFSKDALSPSEQEDLFAACGQTLREGLKIPGGGLMLQTRLEAGELSGQQALFAALAAMELLRLCLGKGRRKLSKEPINLVLAREREGHLALRLFAPHPLKPAKLKFHKEFKKDFAFLAALVIANHGALMTWSGNTEEIRINFK
jgi:hypothetical protein